MQQATMDRFVGYPDHPGYPGDLNVPFFDIVSRTNKYPLKWNESLPLDWEVQLAQTAGLEQLKPGNNRVKVMLSSSAFKVCKGPSM